MPFKKGKNPALTVAAKDMRSLFAALFAAGYEEHDEQRMRRKSEIATFRKVFKNGRSERQNHVQVVSAPDSNIHVYAHTEPSMSLTSVKDMLTHGLAALIDDVCYPAGSRMLIRDLRGIKADLKTKKRDRR